MSHHFSTCQKQNMTIRILLFSKLIAAKWKLGCLRYCTILTQETSAGSTTGFEFVSVCREELSSSSLNHPVQKLIGIGWKDQTWRWVGYLFESRVWDEGLILWKAHIQALRARFEFCFGTTVPWRRSDFSIESY